jgi:peptidoglycan-associated lipoprotein
MKLRSTALFPLLLLATPMLFGSACMKDKTATAGTSSGDLLSSAGSVTAEDLAAPTPITEEELAVLRANFYRVNFEFNSADLGGVAREVLAANAEILMRHPGVRVQVEGHSDHWGSDVYNLALGQHRADSVFRYLTNYGVPQTQLKVISYGEERPMVAEGDRTVEAPNRRAEFLVMTGAVTAASSY